MTYPVHYRKALIADIPSVIELSIGKMAVILKRIPFAALAVALFASCQSSKPNFDQVPIPNSNDLSSVLLLNDRAGHTATGFLHFRNGKMYVITARHFANYMIGNDSVGILLDGGWKRISTKLIGHSNPDIDITVFSFQPNPNQTAPPLTPILSDADTLALGCDVWSLGFPLGYLDTDPQRRYPYPILNHAYLALRAGHPTMYYLNGICSPGCSGAPVYGRTADGTLRLIGVVSYLTQTADSINTGIFVAYGADYADSLIDRNPIGFALHN